MKKEIGCNKSAYGIVFGGLESSFNGVFKDELVRISTGIGDLYSCTIGDISSAYKMLEEKIIQNSPQNEKEVIILIFQVVNDYFGTFDNVIERFNNYPNHDDVHLKGIEHGKVANLKGKNSGVCVERAMLSQNLLKSCNIDSYYKASGIIRNDEKEIHSYNVITLLNGEHYIYDATIPTLVDNEVSPLVCKIPDYVFNKIISPSASIGYAVSVKHYNPLQDRDEKIIYDAGHQDELYVSETSKVIK